MAFSLWSFILHNFTYCHNIIFTACQHVSVLAYLCCLAQNVFFGKLSQKQEDICETALAISDFAQYSYQCLVDKDVIVEGGFPVVFNAKLPENGKQIVVNNDTKKSLIKEVQLLSEAAASKRCRV